MSSVTGHCSFSENCVQVARIVQEIKAGQVTQHHNSVWHSQSPICEQGTDVGSQSQMRRISTYCETKCHHPFAQNKEGDCHRLFLLLHDDTHRHTAAHIMTTLPMLNWNILNNPAYLMTSDFHLAGLIKEAVRG
jgi:hypothetical protein